MRFLCFVCAGVAALMMAGAMPSAAGNWIRATSPHFIVYSDTDQARTTAYITRLEQYRYVLQTFYGQQTADDGQFPKFQMYFLKDRKDFKEVWPTVPDYVGGVYRPCEEGQAAFAMDQKEDISHAKSITSQQEDDSQLIIFHEYAHQFMFENADKLYPHWFIEGFADYYGATRMLDDQIAVGVPAQERQWELNVPVQLSYADVLRGSPTVYTENHIALFYAQAWLLTHYLMSTPDRQAQLDAYITAYNNKEDPVAAFEKATGIAVKDLPRVLETYTKKEMQVIVYKVKDLPAPKVELSDMPASSQKLLLWDAAARVCMWPQDKSAYMDKVRQEAALYPNDDYAQMALARIEVIIGDESKAEPYLSKVAAQHPDDADALGLLGQTWFLMTQHGTVLDGQTKASQMKLARDDLYKGYQLDPLSAADLYYLSLAQQDLPGYPNDTAVNAAMQAQILVPSVTGYATQAAGVLIQKARYDEARTMLQPIANNPHGGKASAWAQAVIDGIDAHKSQDEITALFKTPIASDAPAAKADDGKSDKKDGDAKAH